MMNNNTVRIVRVAVHKGKANKWVATNNVLETELETYKEEITAMLHRTGTKPATKITFTKYFVDEVVVDNNCGHYYPVWHRRPIQVRETKEVWRKNLGEEF